MVEPGNTTNPPMTRADEVQISGRGMGSYRRRPNTDPILAPYTLKEGAFAQRDPAMQARLIAESIGFPNLATDNYVWSQAKMAIKAAVSQTRSVNEYIRNKFLIFYRLYRGESLAEYSYNRIRLHSPEPFKAVETQHPRLMRALFGNQRWFKLIAEGNTDDDNAVCQERLIRDQLRASRYYAKASRFVRDGLIYGTAVQKTYWKQDVSEMTYRDGKRIPDETGLPGTTKVELSEVKRTELSFDGNWTDNVSIFDFWGPANSSDASEAEWLADQSDWPDYKVKMMGELGHWVNLDELKDHPGTNDSTSGDEFKERKSYSQGIYDPRQARGAPYVPRYKVVDYWGPLVIKKEGRNYTTKPVNIVCIDPEGACIIVRVTQSPYWHQQKPYQIWRPIALEGELFGIGTIEMIARDSCELDTKKNLAMASAQLAGNPACAIADDANIPEGQLILQPGVSWHVPDPQNSIVPIQIPDVTDVVYKAMGDLKKEIRETTGTTSPIMGASDPFGSSKTATQYGGEVDEANTRLSGPIAQWEVDVGEPMLHQMAWNNQQFLSYPRIVREIGAFGLQYTDRYTIRPEDVIGRFLVSILCGTRWTMKQQQVQQLVNLLDRAPVVNQMYGPQAIKMIPLWATILEHGFDIRNVEDFVTLPPAEAGLLTTIEEHACWYHGNVPPVRKDDNHAVHVVGHLEEFKTAQFEQLEKHSPATAERARRHAMQHMRWAAQAQDGQMKALMDAYQQGKIQELLGGGASGAGAGIEGAATPNQQPGSPQVRRNETERSNGVPQKESGQTKSAAMSNAPNAGAQ